MSLNYNPFNGFIQEYLCKRLSSLNTEQYRLLSASERMMIYNKSKIIGFVKKNNIFQILSVLTKIGLNWGIYIIDESFNIDEFKELADRGDFIEKLPSIKKALHDKKSFITNNKYFSHLQNMIANANHGLEAIWDRRFIKFSDKISTKVKDSFDNYNIMHPEVDFKKASQGNLLMLDMFRNLPKITQYCADKGLTSADFVLLCEMYYNSEKWYSSTDINNIYNSKYSKRIKPLLSRGFVSEFKSTYNITTAGILFVGEIMSKFLDCVYLD